MGRIFLGYWNCDSCNNKMIKGNIKNCPNCGKRVGPQTKYIATVKREYINEDVVSINKNPDWLCDHCNQYNLDNDKFCVSCGAPKKDVNLNYFQVRKMQREKGNRALNDSYQIKTEEVTNSKYKTYNIRFSYTNFFKKAILGILVSSVFILAIIFLIKIFTPKEEVLTIDSFEWCYTLNIDKLKTFDESDWELPYGARLKYTQDEIYDYNNVIDHYVERTKEVKKTKIIGYETRTIGIKDLGNGYFEEETEKFPVYESYTELETYEEPVYKKEPIYKTKYYYEIDKMVFDRNIVTTGTNKKPYWGKVELSSNEEISSKVQIYFVYCIDEKGKIKKIVLDFDDWSYVEYGNTYTFKVNVFGFATLVK